MSSELGVPLADFVQGKKQPEVAELIGVTQSAVSQMLKSHRDIRVREGAEGRYEAVEIRIVGTRKPPKVA